MLIGRRACPSVDSVLGGHLLDESDGAARVQTSAKGDQLNHKAAFLTHRAPPLTFTNARRWSTSSITPGCTQAPRDHVILICFSIFARGATTGDSTDYMIALPSTCSTTAILLPVFNAGRHVCHAVRMSDITMRRQAADFYSVVLGDCLIPA